MAARRLPVAALPVPGGEIAADGAILDGLEIAFAAVAGVGEEFVGHPPRRALNGHEQRLQLVLVTALLGEPMGDDHLPPDIGRGSCVAAPDEAVGGLEGPALGIGEVALGLVRWLRCGGCR